MITYYYLLQEIRKNSRNNWSLSRTPISASLMRVNFAPISICVEVFGKGIQLFLQCFLILVTSNNT